MWGIWQNVWELRTEGGSLGILKVLCLCVHVYARVRVCTCVHTYLRRVRHR